jgi:Ca2+-binding EF-hand superfamily protein
LRDLFDSLDIDKSGKISRTDLEVAHRRITGELLSEQQLCLLWRRMDKELDEYISYDNFMFEMLPRIKKKQQPKRTKTALSRSRA